MALDFCKAGHERLNTDTINVSAVTWFNDDIFAHDVVQATNAALEEQLKAEGSN
jgi:hypothetical protein